MHHSKPSLKFPTFVYAEHESIPPGPEELSKDYTPQNTHETCQNPLFTVAFKMEFKTLNYSRQNCVDSVG